MGCCNILRVRPIKHESRKVARQPFGLIGKFLVIVEVCFPLMVKKFMEYFQGKVYQLCNNRQSRMVVDLVEVEH